MKSTKTLKNNWNRSVKHKKILLTISMLSDPSINTRLIDLKKILWWFMKSFFMMILLKVRRHYSSIIINLVLSKQRDSHIKSIIRKEFKTWTMFMWTMNMVMKKIVSLLSKNRLRSRRTQKLIIWENQIPAISTTETLNFLSENQPLQFLQILT